MLEFDTGVLSFVKLLVCPSFALLVVTVAESSAPVSSPILKNAYLVNESIVRYLRRRCPWPVQSRQHRVVHHHIYNLGARRYDVFLMDF